MSTINGAKIPLGKVNVQQEIGSTKFSFVCCVIVLKVPLDPPILRSRKGGAACQSPVTHIGRSDFALSF